MTREPIIQVDGMSFSYGAHPVLDEVSFTVHRGEYVAMVGPNGGGKTTLLRLLLGLEHPDRGSVRLFGGSPERARAGVGYMPQHAHLDPQFPITVEDVVLMGRLKRGRGLYSREDREAARASLADVGLEGYEGHSFSALSGGQRQRVLLARALAGRPELLLLDEPTASVDVDVEQRLQTFLDELSRRMTILLVTHDLGFVTDEVHSCLCVNRTVRMHPIGELTGEVIRDLYGRPMRQVRHDRVIQRPG
jgi:zinc transport system ATP-binding protein